MQAIFARANLKTREYNAKDTRIHVLSPQFQKRLFTSAVSTESNDKATNFHKIKQSLEKPFNFLIFSFHYLIVV